MVIYSMKQLQEVCETNEYQKLLGEIQSNKLKDDNNLQNTIKVMNNVSKSDNGKLISPNLYDSVYNNVYKSNSKLRSFIKFRDKLKKDKVFPKDMTSYTHMMRILEASEYSLDKQELSKANARTLFMWLKCLSTVCIVGFLSKSSVKDGIQNIVDALCNRTNDPMTTDKDTLKNLEGALGLVLHHDALKSAYKKKVQPAFDKVRNKLSEQNIKLETDFSYKYIVFS